MTITYKTDTKVTVEAFIDVFNKSGINRPTDQPERIQHMLDKADILVTAWDGDNLAGVARSLTDYCYCCYLSDLAVDKAYQKSGIGKKLVEITREIIGNRVSLILLSAPDAMNYYPKIGFEKMDNAFAIRRGK